MSSIIFMIDGVSIADHGVFVSNSKGWASVASFKEGLKNEWSDENGYDLDLKNRSVNARAIELTCFLFANTYAVFYKKYVDFFALIDKSGHRRLTVIIESVRLEFNVFRTDETDVKIEFDNANNVGEFTLKLVENQPIKKTLKFKPAAANSNTITVTFGSAKIMTIDWGDGAVEYSKPGLNTYKHKYVSTKEFYPLIQGSVDTMEGFTTNATALWNR